MNYGSVVNYIIDNEYSDGKIRVGVGVTELCYSDRRAYFIKEIYCNKKGEPRELKLERAYLKALGNGYFEISREKKEGFFRDWDSLISIKKTRKGNWTSNGREDGNKFKIGSADEYYDESF